MKQILVVVVLVLAVLLSIVMSMLMDDQSGVLANLPGLVFVIGGTLLTTVMSQSLQKVMGVFRNVRRKLGKEKDSIGNQVETIVRLIEDYRDGRVRSAERELDSLPDGLFRYGARLVLDNTPSSDLARLLQWRSGSMREHDAEDVHILRSMAAFAPAFGMLGTIFGLVQMLYGLGDSGLDELGKTMGFAMMTTVYGLVAANIIFKPLAIKLERHAKKQQAWQHTQFELVLMLQQRKHTRLVRDYIQAFSGLGGIADNDRLSSVKV